MKLNTATIKYIPAILGDLGKTAPSAVATAMKIRNKLMRPYELLCIASFLFPKSGPGLSFILCLLFSISAPQETTIFKHFTRTQNCELKVGKPFPVTSIQLC